MNQLNISAQHLFAYYESHHQLGDGALSVLPHHYEPDGEVVSIEGRYVLYSPFESCLIALLDITPLSDFSTCTPLENYLTLEIVLSGVSEVRAGEHAVFNKGMPRMHLSNHAKGSSKTRLHKANESVRSLGIWLPPAFLTERFGLELDATSSKYPISFNESFQLDEDSFVTLPLPSEIQQIAEAMFNHSFTGKLEEQYLQAKCAELLCWFSDFITTSEFGFLDTVTSASPFDAQLISIFPLLEKDPSLWSEKIALALSINEDTLSRHFKRSYGLSLRTYLLQYKMQAARKILQDTRRPILEVALTVGYEDQSSFGRAYKRYFKCTPSSERV